MALSECHYSVEAWLPGLDNVEARLFHECVGSYERAETFDSFGMAFEVI